MLLKTFIKDISSSRHVIRNIVNQTLTVKYKRSFLGFFWSILNPLANMLICSIVFGSIMRFDLKDFVVFLYAGMLPWGIFSQSVEQSASSIINAEGYIKKIYLPKVVFPVSTILSIYINTIFQFVALFLIIPIIGAPMSFTMLFLPVSFAILLIMVTGVSLLSSTVGVYFRDAPYLINIITSAWYYLTPILYPLDRMPETLQTVFRLNPMYYYVQLFRMPVHECRLPDFLTLGITICLALLMFFIGLHTFYKHQNEFVFKL